MSVDFAKANRAAFELSKWYADCISLEGDVFIGYCAKLRLGSISVPYQSALVYTRDQAVESWSSLRRLTLPRASDAQINWRSAPLGIRGEWVSRSKPLRETVYCSDEGEVEWSCLQPNSRASVNTKRGHAIGGTGYIEHLRLTIPPWRMPISQLRWGRVVAESASLVWIDWKGAFQNTIVYCNGTQVVAKRIGDDGIELSDGAKIAFDQSVMLREGPLGSTVLTSIPGITRFAPASTLRIHERKWRSRVRWTGTRRLSQDAWAIHEVVTWP